MSVTDNLLSLYRVTMQIKSLTSRLNSAQGYLDSQERQLGQLLTRLEQLRYQIQHLNATAGNLEGDALAFDQRIERLREQMNNARTNKEYKAFLTELNTFKAEKDDLELKAIEELTKVDEVKEQETEICAQVTERRRIRQVAQNQLEDRRQEIAQRLVELEAERGAAEALIRPEALADFQALSSQHDGESMAQIEEADRKRAEYTCGSCYMTIPLERLSALLSRGDLTLCPSCRRILYVSSEMREEFGHRLARK